MDSFYFDRIIHTHIIKSKDQATLAISHIHDEVGLLDGLFYTYILYIYIISLRRLFTS